MSGFKSPVHCRIVSVESAAASTRGRESEEDIDALCFVFRVDAPICASRVSIRLACRLAATRARDPGSDGTG